jgi:peptidoglycan/xylan/chitin deacetylase (PgdA/CDA1 family)
MNKMMVTLKYALSLALHFFGITFLINRLIKLSHRNQPTLTVLCYHSVDDSRLHTFERQLDYLIEHDFQFVSKRQLLELITCPTNFNNHTKYVCLTFDDCYENNYTIVRPLLLRKKIPAIFFAVSAKLGQIADWEDHHPNQRLMTKDQLKQMALTFAVGAHTQNHVPLGGSKPEAIFSEIINSKNELSEIIGQEIDVFAYPKGSYNSEVLKYISQCHFEAAFTIEQHTNYSYTERYAMGRYLIDPGSFISFKLKVTGGYDWFFFLKKSLSYS